MKVLILLFCEYPGGSAAAFHGQRIALGLISAGAEVKVICYRPSEKPGPDSGVDDRGVPFRSVPVKRNWRFIPAYLPLTLNYGHQISAALEQLVRDGGWDAILYYGRSWLAARQIIKVADRHGVPLVPYQVEWHGFSWPLLLNGSLIDWGLYRRLLLPHAKAMIGISQFWKAWADGRRIANVVIPSFADVDEKSSPAPSSRDGGPFRIVFVGGWNPRELPRTLFDGLERAIDLGVDLSLIVVGAIGQSRLERPAMREFARREKLRKRTTFTGWLGPNPLKEQLATADAFVLLREENRETKALFPTRLPEYLGSGIPVIVSSAGDIPTYLEHRRSAWIIPPGHAPQELAQAIHHLSVHEDERVEIGRVGWEVAAGQLSCPTLGQKLFHFLKSIRP